MMVVETLAVKDLAVLVLESKMQADVIDRLAADVGYFARDDEVRRHAARMHNHVARDYHLELVVGYDLGLRMIVAGVHIRFRRGLFAVLYLHASPGKGGAGRTEG